MGLQAIEAARTNGSAAFPVDQNTRDTATVHCAERQGVSSQTRGAPIAVSSVHRPKGLKTVGHLRGARRLAAHVSTAIAACILWLLVGTLGNEARCSEESSRVHVFGASVENGHARAELDARRNNSLLA